MDQNTSLRLRNALVFSHEEAFRLHNSMVNVGHLLLGILRDGENTAVHVMQAIGVNLAELKLQIEKKLINPDLSNFSKDQQIPLSKSSEKILRLMYLEAKAMKADTIGTEHMMLSILKEESNEIMPVLRGEGLSYDNFKSQTQAILSGKNGDIIAFKDELDELDEELDDLEDNFPSTRRAPSPTATARVAEGKSKTPVLDNFGRDLTRFAEEGRLDPMVGREKELERIAQILSRRKKNNPILIGEPGVGKSAIAEGLALRIAQKRVPRVLLGKRLITLDLASIVAGTKYRGQFEERMKSILNELEKNPDIIVFIDEIHTIVGAGNASGSLDASNMFKPALARGEIQCIGATTLDEYRNNIEKDGALERRFQKVIVDATTADETLEILNNIKVKYEDHHLVSYTPEALKACVYYTTRYITDRSLPDKAIDALDEAGSRVHIRNFDLPSELVEIEKEIEAVKEKKKNVVLLQKYEEAGVLRDLEVELTQKFEEAKEKWVEQANIHRVTVTDEDVAEVVSMMSGVPIQRVSQDECGRLIQLEDQIQSMVIGQNEAVRKLVKAIRRNRAGLKDPNKPIGNFIFLGPTGVGKTHLAKMLAKFMFDSESALIRIDMSEYMEKFAVSRLIGAPPGYVGYEEGGLLTEKVRRKPYSIILLDEVEKAHPDVFNIMLQVLDDGQLTDSLGRKVDFRNTIIIMTSNVGSRQMKDFGKGIGYQSNNKAANQTSYTQSLFENAMKKTFSPEFLNRIDDIILFEPLKREDIHKIIDIELSQLYQRVNDMGIRLEITTEAKDFLVDKAWNPDFGARPLKRAIQNYIEDAIAEEIIHERFSAGSFIRMDKSAQADELVICKEGV